MRAPEHPIGWPSATAPPCTLTFAGFILSSFMTAQGCTANASLSSIASKSSIEAPSFARSFGIATVGAIMTHSGFMPPVAYPVTRAIGFTPSSFAFASDMSVIAAAPSLICEAFAAVIVPSFLKTGLSFAIPSTLESGRGPSSRAMRTGSPFFCGISTDSISSRKYPFSWASTAFRWLWYEYSSISPRDTPYFSETSSAVLPMW